MDYVGLIGKSMDVAMLKTHVISDNITNYNTPMYKAKQVDDSAVFSLDSYSPMKKTDPRHMDGGSGSYGDPVVTTRTDTQERSDGNNVDLNSEMVNMVKASTQYKEAVEAINREFALRKLSLGSNG